MTEAGGIARPASSKHRGGGKRGGQLARLAVGAPLAAAALFLLLLFFSVYSFSSMIAGGGSVEEDTLQPQRGRTAGHASELGAHDPSRLRSSGSSSGSGHHSSWLSAAALWAEENRHQVSGERVLLGASSPVGHVPYARRGCRHIVS